MTTTSVSRCYRPLGISFDTFSSFEFPKIAPPPYWEPRSLSRENVAVSASETGHQPISRPPSWFCTTLADYSSPTLPGYCTGLPVMGFVMFHRRDSDSSSRVPTLRSFAPRVQRADSRLLLHRAGPVSPSQVTLVGSPRTLPPHPWRTPSASSSTALAAPFQAEHVARISRFFSAPGAVTLTLVAGDDGSLLPWAWLASLRRPSRASPITTEAVCSACTLCQSTLACGRALRSRLDGSSRTSKIAERLAPAYRLPCPLVRLDGVSPTDAPAHPPRGF